MPTRVSHKKLVAQESNDHEIFPEDVRAFARNYHKQKKIFCSSTKMGSSV